ncbi:Alpha-L-Rha alpha-1,2-L-rhamnosyltransferase/alpha-L-Rha alpha-1,3-L-rhamnosyltransferase [hydrothermal vent metagenome]|uniref:Alpha-L-Rha alpha-1,2-L-rhamnosyltransferase/alpha-L-Rha alpha-1,3-L-rhamnosyltransferase n=1 Tax=hydrothermal vent metagenome TaxID=652676 RepID=A0A1W1C1I0_9ZZZZ
MSNRAIVLVHYDRDDIVDDYVYAYIKALRLHASHFVFVSTSELSTSIQNELSKLCDTVIIRENIGYDFMSYQKGLESFEYQKYDEVLLCNDSVYAPLFPLEKLFTQMKQRDCDFWGVTDNNDMGYHIQSYFFLVKSPILKSQVFQEFWQNIEVLENKIAIIEKYEVGFSQALIKAGFTPSVSTKFQASLSQKLMIFIKKFTPKNIIKKFYSLYNGRVRIIRIGKINATHYFWRELIIKGNVPFIKIELLRDNPLGVDIKEVERVIGECTEYDTKLILKHLERMRNI